MKKFLLLAALLPALAFGHGAPVIWNGTSAKWLPSGLQSAGVCKLSAAGVMSSSTVSDSELASSYLYADGSRGLTGNWNAGAHNITASTFIGALTGNVTGNLTGNVTGNADTATALSANPAACSANQFVTDTAANGDLTCSQPDHGNLAGLSDDDHAQYLLLAGRGTGGQSITDPVTIAGTQATQTVLTLDPQIGNNVTFGFAGSLFDMTHGGSYILRYNGGFTGMIGARTPRYSLDFNGASTDTTPSSSMVYNSGLIFPWLTLSNTSSTANNWSALAFAGASTNSTAVDSAIVAVHEAHTEGAESGRLDFYARNAGTIGRVLSLAKDKVVTMDGYGAGVLQADSSGVISSSAVDLATSDVTGTLPVANGGTGQTSYTDGQLLIGNSSGNTLTKSTLTAGSNITITNGGGSITIASSGGSSSLAEPAVKTTDYTLTNSDDVILCNTTTSMNVTMHSAASATTKSYRVKNIGSGNCNVLSPTTFDRASGYTSMSIPGGGLPTGGVNLIPDSGGTSWLIF